MKTETKNGTMIKLDKKVHRKLKMISAREGKTLSATIGSLISDRSRKVNVKSETPDDVVVEVNK